METVAIDLTPEQIVRRLLDEDLQQRAPIGLVN
jgi:hypothetical protein